MTGYGSCWAANPSSLGTHWFTNSCGDTGPQGYDGYADLFAYGGYINWDFLLDSLSTEVNQTAEVGVEPIWGVFHNFSHYDWGEASFLIFGSVEFTFANTCF